MHKIFRTCVHALKSSKIAFPENKRFCKRAFRRKFYDKNVFLPLKKVARAFSR